METVVILGFDGVHLLDVAGPASVFTEANEQFSNPPYRIVMASSEGGVFSTNSGIAMVAVCASTLIGEKVDTVIVPGGDAAALRRLLGNALVRESMLPILKAARRVASICTGAFVLAAWELLEGRRATTHWAALEELQARFPSVRVDTKAMFVEDGPIWTSAGVSTGIDLALALVERDLGSRIASQIARRLVLQMRRPGHQSQYSTVLHAQEGQYCDLTTWISENLGADLSLEKLAVRSGQSPRTFHRRFTSATGLTPAAFVERVRLDRARALLEAGKPPKEVARGVGFGSLDRLGRAFNRAFGLSPSAYRTMHNH